MQVISFRAIRCISGKESHVGAKSETTRTQVKYGHCLFSISITFTLRRTLWQAVRVPTFRKTWCLLLNSVSFLLFCREDGSSVGTCLESHPRNQQLYVHRRENLKLRTLFDSSKRFPHQNSVHIVCYPVYRSMYCPLETKPHRKEKLGTNVCEVSRLTLVIIDVIWMMTWHGKWTHHVWVEVQAASEFIRAGRSQNERKRRLKTWESGVHQ
jgi:hypothetical protein